MASTATADVAQRAKALYESELRSQLEATNLHDFVAIEPDSKEFYIGQSLSEAIKAARTAHPNRLVFTMRIGHETAVNMGVLNS